MQETQDAVAARKRASCCLSLFLDLSSRFARIIIFVLHLFRYVTLLQCTVRYLRACRDIRFAQLIIDQSAWLNRDMCCSFSLYCLIHESDALLDYIVPKAPLQRIQIVFTGLHLLNEESCLSIVSIRLHLLRECVFSSAGILACRIQKCILILCTDNIRPFCLHVCLPPVPSRTHPYRTLVSIEVNSPFESHPCHCGSCTILLPL